MSGEGRRATRSRARRPDRAAARARTREQRAGVTEPGPVMDAAGRFLEARPRSVAETRRHLVDAGWHADLVESVLARLQDLGYLDDPAFARAWVESRDRAHPRGESALRRELALKGIAADTIADVLLHRRADAGTDLDTTAAARVLGHREAALLREPDERKRRAKAYALLARHGFDPETCRTAVAAWIRGADDDLDSAASAESAESSEGAESGEDGGTWDRT